MWELQFDSRDQSMFGCLNPACKRALSQTFEHSFFLLIGYCLKLSAVTIFAIGLAAHSNRFMQVYQPTGYFNTGILGIFISICVAGIVSIWTFQSCALKTNSQQIGWSLKDEGQFPYLSQSTSVDETGWYNITDLKLKEACLEGPCEPLLYQMNI